MASAPVMGQWGTQEPRKEQFEHTQDAPQRGDKEAIRARSGLTKEHEDMLVNEVIKAYRTQWATDRIMRMPTWLKNTEMDKGRQVLGWDPITRTYFDAVAYSRMNNQETDYSYLEKYVNNITQTVRRNFTAAVARAVPPVIVRPVNAENLADQTTAKAAQEAISIVERHNEAPSQLSFEGKTLYLYGVYFKWTRFKIDGSWAGYTDQPIYGDVDAQLSEDHFHCLSCGSDTDASSVDMSDPDNMQCANCESQLQPQDFYLGEKATVPGITGVKKKPNGMVKWSIYSPLQIDTDPTVETIPECDVLALEMEVNVAQLRAVYPDLKKEIVEGTESGTSDNASYERLVRTQVYSSTYTVTADIFASRTTWTQVWVQPAAYYRCQDDAFLEAMEKAFPYGCKVSMNGALVLDIRPAVMEKEWTACKLHDGYGMYPPSVADNVVPFNERFNNISNILDDYMERCATGITLVDTKRVDPTQLSGKALTGGQLNPTPTVGEGQQHPLSDAIYHFAFQLDAKIFDYLDRLWNYCLLISGVPPQVGGTGRQEGVETAKGQKQMLDQALGTLGDIYSRIKTEHAAAGQNAIECLQQNMQYTGDLWSVIEENGSEFRNNYVHIDEMQGRVRVYPNTDEGLPMSPEQKREWVNNMLAMADKNPVAQAWFDVPSNQELASTISGLPDSVTPGEAQRSKTLQDINKLLSIQGPPPPMLGPNGQPVLDDDGTPRVSPTIAPNKWVEDYITLRNTIVQFCAENSDSKDKNPNGWANLIAFYRLACEYEASVEQYKATLKAKVQAAGVPPPPPGPEANPAIQQIEAEAIKQAMGAVDGLSKLGALPPLPQGSSIQGQVAAYKELVDSVEKMMKQ
jgi:hypothetical protein